MIIRKCVGGIYDVFLSETEWGKWVRVRKTKKGVHWVSGLRVNNLQEIYRAIDDFNKYSQSK